MADYRDLEVRLSGGASNTTPSSALGGAMSTVSGGLVAGQGFSWTPMTGLTIVRGTSNPVGAGSLDFTLTGTLLRWMPYTLAYGPTVDVSVDGTYVLYDSTLTSMIVVTKATSLPGANTTSTVTVSNTQNAIYDDITFAQSSAGMTEYRCIFFKNTHASETMTTLRVWAAQDPDGASMMQYGADPNGISAAAVSIGNETTAPSGVTFSPPTLDSPLTLGSVPAGGYVGLWLKRNIPAVSAGGISQSLTKIGATWL